MIFSWLRKRRRRKLIAQPFPTTWIDVLTRNVARYPRLSADQQEKLRRDIQVLVAEKNWEGCGGLEMTDEVRVTVASQIALMTLGFEEQYFDRVQSILVYPNAYVAPGRTVTRAGIVLEEDSAREGEAWYRGPVILSWPEVLAGATGQSGGDNLVFHEFAHQLDMLNGSETDGTPPLESAEQLKRWKRVIHEHYQRLVRDCEEGRPNLLDCYGATSISEFFSVATERFFELPEELQRTYPQLYALLREYYRQDPR